MDISKEKLDNYIKNQHTPICSFCGNNTWNISSKIFELLEFDANGLQLGGPVYPVVPITCNNCGNTLFINALVAGLLEQKFPNNGGI